MHSGMLISPANQFSVTEISTARINKPTNSICNTYPDIPLSGLSQSVCHPFSLPVPEITWTGDLPYHQVSTGHHLSPPGHSTQWCFAERARYNGLFQKNAIKMQSNNNIYCYCSVQTVFWKTAGGFLTTSSEDTIYWGWVRNLNVHKSWHL